MPYPKYKIEKGIPIPPRDAGGLPWTLRQMDPGDSVLVPSSVKYVAQAMTKCGKGTGRKFVSRQEDAGRRIWRVS